MPKVGDEEYDYTTEGIAAAQEKSEATGIPMTNAMDRNVTDFTGSGNTGYGKIGMYKKGGDVKVKGGAAGKHHRKNIVVERFKHVDAKEQEKREVAEAGSYAAKGWPEGKTYTKVKGGKGNLYTEAVKKYKTKKSQGKGDKGVKVKKTNIDKKVVVKYPKKKKKK